MKAASTRQLITRRRFAGATAGLSVVLALAAGLGLRLWMLMKYFQVYGDSLVYGDIAKHMIRVGHYLITRPTGEVLPTMIRLPGYPLFLELCFRLFGMENYAPACWVQIALELMGCLLLADFARRIAPAPLGKGAAHGTLWLAALCPFTAIYAAQPLTESLTLFAIALALWSMACFCRQPGWVPALWFTVAVTAAALLRPDGALLGLSLAPALVVGLGRTKAGCPTLAAFLFLRLGWDRKHLGAPSLPRSCFCGKGGKPQNSTGPKLARLALVCLLLALAPFAAWSWRNWQVFHLFQPLVPRYANDPDQATYPGWQRWVKSWSLDFVSTSQIYWPVPGKPLMMNKLPRRAFDSPAQYAETAALVADYNNRDGATDLVPDVDERFGQLAQERIAAHPLRYYLWLPLGRLADMWMRPRVELFYDDLDWWVYAHHPARTRECWAYAGLNGVYLLLGLAGLCRRPRYWPWMVAYFALRGGLLMTLEAPEARYTLECFPMLFALGGVWLAGGWQWMTRRLRASGEPCAVTSSASG